MAVSRLLHHVRMMRLDGRDHAGASERWRQQQYDRQQNGDKIANAGDGVWSAHQPAFASRLTGRQFEFGGATVDGAGSCGSRVFIFWLQIPREIRMSGRPQSESDSKSRCGQQPLYI